MSNQLEKTFAAPDRSTESLMHQSALQCFGGIKLDSEFAGAKIVRAAEIIRCVLTEGILTPELERKGMVGLLEEEWRPMLEQAKSLLVGRGTPPEEAAKDIFADEVPCPDCGIVVKCVKHQEQQPEPLKIDGQNVVRGPVIMFGSEDARVNELIHALHEPTAKITRGMFEKLRHEAYRRGLKPAPCPTCNGSRTVLMHTKLGDEEYVSCPVCCADLEEAGDLTAA